MLNTPVGNPFIGHLSWHIPSPLDVAAMRNAAIPLIGEHDFSSFCRRPHTGGATLVRRVRRADWRDRDSNGLVVFDIEAASFCHQMVRSLVGTLIDVGLGRRRAADMTAILAARDRNLAGQVAPPHGLMLWEVGY